MNLPRIYPVHIIACLLSLISVTAWTSADLVDEAEIRQAREKSNQAIREHDIEGLLGTLAPAYHLVSAANRQLSGHLEVREYVQKLFTTFPDAVYMRTPSGVTVNSAGDSAAETGTWNGSWTSKGQKISVQGTYFAKWSKINNRWVILAEVFVSL